MIPHRGRRDEKIKMWGSWWGVDLPFLDMQNNEAGYKFLENNFFNDYCFGQFHVRQCHIIITCSISIFLQKDKFGWG